MKTPFYFHGVEQTPLRKLLFMGALVGGKEVEDTASGNPLTFLTDLARPLKSCLATWQPHQSGTGDPSPENVRPVLGMDGVTVWHTGKNIIDKTQFVDGKVWWQGSMLHGYNANCASPKIPVVPGATYFRQGETENQNYVSWFDKNGDYISQEAWGFGYAKTIPANVYFVGMTFSKADKDNAMVFVGNSASEYEPYSGITYAVEFPVLGKNLLDINVFSRNGITASKVDGKAVLSGTAEGYAYSVTFSSLTFPAGTYTASISGLQTGMECVITKDGQWYRSLSSTTTFTLTEDALIGGYVRTSDGTEIDTTIAIMLEQGSSASTFEPYTNTIYGGTLDLTTGVLTAEYVSLDLSTLDWTYWAQYQVFYSDSIPNSKKVSSDKMAKWFMDKYAQVGARSSGSSTTTMPNYSYCEHIAYTPPLMFLKNTEFTKKADLKEHLKGVQFVYELAEPVILATLTPQQITALIGDNTIWADADDLSVTYLKKG